MSQVSALETKVDLLLVQNAEIKAALDKFNDHCREDMRGVYDHVGGIQQRLEARIKEVENHAACQKGKELSTGKLVAIIGVVSMFVQGTFVMLQYIRG